MLLSGALFALFMTGFWLYCLTMSHAIAPPMNVRLMMTIQAGLDTPLHSAAGVSMASVRQ